MKKRGKRYLFLSLFAAAGALGGFLYYLYVGCASGVCPITSSPVLSTGYGAAIGWLLGMIAMPEPKNKEEDNTHA